MAFEFDANTAQPEGGAFDPTTATLHEPSGIVRRIGDQALKLGQGVVGVPEAAVGVADLVSNGQVGKAVENAGVRFKDAKQVLGEYMSPEQKAADAEVQNAKGFMPTVSAMVRNPSTIVGSAVESAPSMLVGGAASRGLLAVAPKIGAIAAGAAGEGITAAGQNAEQVRQEDANGTLTPTQSAWLAGSGVLTGLISGAAGKVANKLGIGDVHTMLANGKLGAVGEEAIAAGANKGLFRKAGEGALTEGVLQELPQSYQEQVAQNIAQGKPWDEGAANAGVQGMMAGGLTGAGGNIVSHIGEGSHQTTVPAPAADTTPAPLMLGNTPDPLLGFPDGTVARRSEVEAHINSLPADQQPAARAKMMGLAPQVSPDIAQAPVKASEAMGLDPTAGPMSAAATLAVDSGVHQAHVDQQTSVADQAAYDAHMAEQQQVAQQQDTANQPITTGPLAEAALSDDDKRAVLFSNPAVADGGMRHPGTQDGDILNGVGAPFPNMFAALRRAKMEGADWMPVKVANGQFVARRRDANGTSTKVQPVPATGTGSGVLEPGASMAPGLGNDSTARPAVEPWRSGDQPNGKPVPSTSGADAAVRAPADVQNPAPRTEAAPAAPQTQAPAAVESHAATTGQPTGAGSTALEANGLTHVDQAAHAAATSPLNNLPQPTDAMKKAGNYQKGHVNLNGLDLSIENPAGSVRSGTDKTGKTWTNTLQHHYGYIKGTVGNDKDHVDVFVKPGTPLDYAGKVFVIDQVHPDTGRFDEHKVIVGAKNALEARHIYQANYARGWKGLQSVTPMAFDQFKAWVKDGPKTTPIAQETSSQPQEQTSVPQATQAKPQQTQSEAGPIAQATESAAGNGVAAANEGTGVKPQSLPERMRAARDAAKTAAAPAPVAPQGKEVSRFNGKYGKGMNLVPAKMEAARLNNTNDGIRYTAEEHNDPKLDNPYAVVGRKPAKETLQSAKPDVKSNHDNVDYDFTRGNIEPAGKQGSRNEVVHTDVSGAPKPQGWVEATSARGTDGKLRTLSRGAVRSLSAQDFSFKSLGHNTENPSSGLGVFLTTSAKEATRWGNVEQFHLDIRNPFKITADQLPGFDSTAEAYRWREDLRKQGYDSIIVVSATPELGGKSNHVVVFDPSQVIPKKQDTAFKRGDDATSNLSEDHARAIEDMARSIRSTWANAPEVVVGRHLLDPRLPPSVVADMIANQGNDAVGAPRGVWENGKVYLIAQTIPTVEAAREVLFHEALGHMGLRGVFGANLKTILQQIATMRRSEVQAVARQYGLDVNNNEHMLTAAEEVLANLAQTRPEIGFVQRAVAAIRQWLRANVKGFSNLRLSNSDLIANYILPARQFVEQGAKAQPVGNAAPAFSRGVGQTLKDKINERKVEITGQTNRQYTPEQLAAMKSVGFQVEQPSLADRAKSMWKDVGRKMAQGIVDQFAPVKDLDKQAYGLLRLAKGAAGAFETMLNGGKLKLTDNVYDIDEKSRGGVVDRLLVPLHGEHHDFFRWIAANRAERLQGEGKENLFTPQDIAALKTLASGTTNFDYTIQTGLAKGKVTRDRAQIYSDANRVFNEFNTNVLDMAEQSGLIDGASRKVWEHEFYVPFYRVADEDSGGVRGMSVKGSALRQQAFKELKGGKNALNADLMDNTLMNWAHLLDASAKNRAAKATIEAAERLGIASGGNQSTLAQMGASIKNKSGVVWFMDGGQKRYTMIDNKGDGPFLMTAINALEYAGMRNPVMNAMGAMKHALTVGVTASPFFKVRNLIRDSVQAIGTGNLGYNPAANIAQGWKLTDPHSDAYFRLLAGGGTIHFGTMLEGSEGKRVQSLIEAGVKDSTILNSDNKLKAFYRTTIEPFVTAYNELGNRGEAINRAALYDQLVKQGVSHADASLQARDLMDFSMQGSFTSIRFLTQVVPFFNARIQGLYKLGKSAKEDPARFGVVLGATALASLALLGAYHDDDDWKKREDWDRNNFWWFKVGGTAFRIPKPFEIGAIATLAERGAELAFDNEMTGKRFGNQVMTLLGDNLSMNPVPQLVKPLLDVYANKDSFSGRPIETLGMERLQPEYRFTNSTSMAARAMSTAANTVTSTVGVNAPSPVQIDSMLKGYFGWLGSLVVNTADVIARPATGQPSNPTIDYMKSVTGGMASDLRDAPSRYVSQLYTQAQIIEQSFGTYRQLVKDGKVQEAAAFLDSNREAIGKYHQMEHAKHAESLANQQAHRVEVSNADGDTKRSLLRVIQERRDRIARGVSG